VHNLYYFSLFLLCLILSGQKTLAQIRDDSTKQIYGTHSTFYVLEEDILNNKKTENRLDTTLNGFHNYGTLYQGETVYQNLGNFATATFPIFYQAPLQIGKTLGFNSSNIYAVDPYRVRYYDTKSPYTSVYYVQGSRGQQILQAEFSRNVNKQWNIGFDVRSVSSRQVIGQSATTTSGANRQANFISVILSTRYFTKDERYQLLSNITTLDGKSKENGGVRIDPAIHTSDSIYNSLFDPLVTTNLYFARTLEKRFNYHLYQQLSPFKSQVIQLYDVFDYQSRTNRYIDGLNTSDSSFYKTNYKKGIVQSPNGIYDPDATNDRTIFHLLENKAGIKGSAGIVSYRAYWRFRDLTYNQSYQYGLDRISPYTLKFRENFLGAVVNINLKDSSNISASAEIYVHGNDKKLNDYFLRAEYKGKLLYGGINSIMSSPTLVQREYNGNHLSWSNDFSSTLTNNAYGGLALRLGDLEIKPSVNYFLVSNYVYYDTLAHPAQTSKDISILYGNLHLRYKLRSFYVENFFRHTTVSGAGAQYIRMPEFYNHTRIYHQNHFFEENLHIQVGFDVFYKSSYFANQYMPINQQFYLNNSFSIPSYWLADFFINFQVKKVNFFLKLTNVALRLFPQNGYVTTPYYPGMKRTFEFGLKWMFFN
jgi:hypothetical protein